MKKIIFFKILFCFLITFHVRAVYAEMQIYQDKPLIFFHEEKEQKQNIDDPLYEQKMRLFGTTDVLNQEHIQKPTPLIQESVQKTQFKTTSIFGKEYTTVPISQTTQMKVIIMPFISSEVLIKEFQRFIQTTPIKLKKFQKIIPKANANTQIKFATLQINGQKYPLTLHETDNEFILQSNKELTQGNYFTIFEYVIENAWQNRDNSQFLRLPVLNYQWPFIINHLAVLILPPSQNMLMTTTPFFGKNKILIPDYFDVSKDNKGNILYQTKHPIPAYTQLNFSLKAKQDAFLQQNQSENLIIYLLYFVITLYTFFYLYLFNKYPKSISVSVLMHINPIFVKFYLKRNSENFYNRLNDLAKISPDYSPYLKKLNSLSRPWKKNLFVFVHTLKLFKNNLFIFIFLPLGVLFTFYKVYNTVPEILLYSVILFPFIGITTLYFFGGKRYFQRLFTTIPDKIIALLSTNASQGVLKNLYRRFIIWTTIFPIQQKMNEIIEKQTK